MTRAPAKKYSLCNSGHRSLLSRDAILWHQTIQFHHKMDFLMKKNVGSLDRIIRLIAGVAALAAGWYFQSWFGLLGLVLIGTALINFCPIYAIVGLNSCPAPGKRA